MSDPNQIELDQLKLLDSHGPGASTSKDPLKAIKSDIQLLLQLFEKAPKSGLDVYDIRKTGWLFRKRSNSTWKKYWAVLDGDQLSFYSNSEVNFFLLILFFIFFHNLETFKKLIKSFPHSYSSQPLVSATVHLLLFTRTLHKSQKKMSSLIHNLAKVNLPAHIASC
jgi:hypothetical protein